MSLGMFDRPETTRRSAGPYGGRNGGAERGVGWPWRFFEVGPQDRSVRLPVPNPRCQIRCPRKSQAGVVVWRRQHANDDSGVDSSRSGKQEPQGLLGAWSDCT